MAVPKRTLMQLWKQGWNEIPEVMGSSGFMLIGLIGLPIFGYMWLKNDWGNHRYKHKYIVYRPDDPRVDRIRKCPDSPPMTYGPGA